MGGKVFEIAKWILIVILSASLVMLWKGNRELKSSYEAYKKDGTYITTYQSQTINQLKRDKSELYDSIKNLKNVKQAVIIKYKYAYEGDTMYIPIELPPVENNVYAFSKNTDTISYTLNVKAKDVEWYKLNFTINDKLTLVNREENGDNELSINTSSGGGTITGTQVFNKKDNKNSIFNRFSFGIQTGLGYGLLTRKPDVYVGIGGSFRLNKIK